MKRKLWLLIVDTIRYWYWRLTGRITVHDLIQAEYDALEPYEVWNG